MKWEEYLKQNEGLNIVGENIYICDVRVSEGGNKFIRNIKPTLVIIKPNSELPKGKKVYYSDYHFLEVKRGKVLKKVIAPFDNTGFRWYAGTSVNVFENYEECVDFYNKQIDEAAQEYDKRIKEIEEQKQNTLNMKIKGE